MNCCESATLPTVGRSPLSLEAFETCRQILISSFTACNDTEFQLISCAISCIMAAVRRLHVSELQGGIAIYFEAQYQSDFATKMTQDEFVATIQRHIFLYKVEQDQTVSFSHCGMATFLQNYRIKGVDASNRTIAMICRAQIQTYQSYNFRSQYTDHSFSFLDYAQRYCQYHCQIAMRTCLSLDFDKPNDTVDISDQFAVLQIEDDWMYVK